MGLGYVGLPLAISFSKTKNCFLTNKNLDRHVIGFDINKNRVNDLKKGFDKTNEISNKDLVSQRNLLFTDKFEDLLGVDVFIVTVPTPIDKLKKPDLNPLKKVSRLIGKIINNRKNNLLEML